MSITNFQNLVKNEHNYTLSNGTFSMTHLLSRIYDFLTTYNINTKYSEEIKRKIEKCFSCVDGDIEINFPLFRKQHYGLIKIKKYQRYNSRKVFDEAVFYLNEIAPEGYYFGATEENGSCFGFYLISKKVELNYNITIIVLKELQDEQKLNLKQNVCIGNYEENIEALEIAIKAIQKVVQINPELMRRLDEMQLEKELEKKIELGTPCLNKFA